MAHPLVAELRGAGPALSVGLVSANLMALGADVERLERAGARLAHFDVMDGCYVPMLTVGPPFIKAVRTSMLKDVHLMIEEPLATVGEYVAAGADVVTIHVESCRHPHRVLQALGQMKNANDPERGIVRGVAVNPGTPLEAIEPLLGDCELVLLLAVNPGWGGQKFIPSTAERAWRAREIIYASGRDVLLGLDGGVKRDNVEEIAKLGADLLVTGSAVFDRKDAAGNARFLQDAVRGAPRP